MKVININNLVLYANHGVYEEEKKLGQKFIISIKIFLKDESLLKFDNIKNTVHYGEVIRDTQKIFTKQNYDLIETAAIEIANNILKKYELIKEIEVEVKKPTAPIKLALDEVSVKITRKRYQVFIGIGSNLGNKSENLDKAIEKINLLKYTTIKKEATRIETKPYGTVEQDDFLNSVIEIDTLLEPQILLKELLNIEKDLKRVRTIKWGPRTIDLDILLINEEIITSKNLIVPHPEMHKRDFVLKPLSEIAPYAIHSLYNKRIIDLLDELNNK